MRYHMRDILRQHGYTAQDALFIFRKYDEDASGLLDFDEFAQ